MTPGECSAEELAAAFADRIERHAMAMPAPNNWTPVLMMEVVTLRSALTQLRSNAQAIEAAPAGETREAGLDA